MDMLVGEYRKIAICVMVDTKENGMKQMTEYMHISF